MCSPLHTSQAALLLTPQPLTPLHGLSQARGGVCPAGWESSTLWEWCLGCGDANQLGGFMVFQFGLFNSIFGLFNNSGYLMVCLWRAEWLEEPLLVSSVMSSVEIQKKTQNSPKSSSVLKWRTQNQAGGGWILVRWHSPISLGFQWVFLAAGGTGGMAVALPITEMAPLPSNLVLIIWNAFNVPSAIWNSIN